MTLQKKVNLNAVMMVLNDVIIPANRRVKTMNCSDLKVGDKVIRSIGQAPKSVKMTMVVKAKDDKMIVCSALQPNGSEVHGGWTFDLKTGAEEDEYLEWGVKYGATGSFIESKVQEQ